MKTNTLITLSLSALMIVLSQTSFAQTRTVSTRNWPSSALKAELAKDHLADTNKYTVITYTSKGISVNGVTLNFPYFEKYLALIEREYSARIRRENDVITLSYNVPKNIKKTASK